MVYGCVGDDGVASRNFLQMKLIFGQHVLCEMCYNICHSMCIVITMKGENNDNYIASE